MPTMVEPSKPFVGNAWEIQPGETSRMYAAFVVYRDMGKERTLQKVSERLAKSLPYIKDLSGRWAWGVRCIAWDMHLQREADAVKVRQREQMVDNHGQAAQALLHLALRGMQPRPLLDEDGRAILDASGQPRTHPPSQSDLRASATALDRAIYHQRLAAGLPTEHTRQDVYLREEVRRAQEVNQTVIRLLEEHLCDECRVGILDKLRQLSREAGEPAAV